MDERYPIGKFQLAEEINTQVLGNWITDIEELPKQLRKACDKLSSEALETPYRLGGWTARQVIHHLADSHMNSYLRFKWSLTEDEPTIKAYDEKLWALEKEAMTGDINLSLDLIESLHARLTTVLKNMDEADFKRGFFHPESNKRWQLDKTLAVYAWHGKHHLGHIFVTVSQACKKIPIIVIWIAGI